MISGGLDEAQNHILSPYRWVYIGTGFLSLATKENPRLCRGEKIAYGEGQSRQEKVSKLE